MLTETSLEIKPRYVDFDLNFEKSPLYEKGDILLVTNDDAVEQSVKNILLTNKYERPFNHSMSGGSRDYLMFEEADANRGAMRTGSHIKPDPEYLKKNFFTSGYASYVHHSENAITRFEPRARGSKVKVEIDSRGRIIAHVEFKNLKTNSQEVSIVLIRER